MDTRRHDITWLGGQPIDWRKPPKANRKVLWTKRTMYGGKVTGSFRHICHLNKLNNLSIRKFGVGIVIIQPAFNTTVAASAGTHDEDMVVDLFIPGIAWWDQQRFFRANGLGSWYRHPPLFGNHVHGFTLPPREGQTISDDFAVHGFSVGVFVPGQLVDYYNHAFGLAGAHTPNSDRSWFPADIEATIFDLPKYIRNRAKNQGKAA